MSEAAQEASFESQLAAATAEAEAEEAAYKSRNGLTSDVEETTSEEQTDDVAALKARIAELEAAKAGEAGEEEETNEEEPSDEQSEEGAEDEPQEINGEQITAADYEQWAPWYEAVASGGSLPEEAFTAAKERFGITDRSMVEDYVRGRIAGRDAAAAEYSSAVRGAAGEVGYDALTAWAAENLSPADIEKYNKAAHSKNKDLAIAATEALVFRMKAEGGVAPKTLQGKTTVALADVYSSMDEMVKDINDVRYDKDRKFRDRVDAKIQRSESSKSVSVTRGSKAY